MEPRGTLAAFDHYLVAQALRFEGIVSGGTALNLLGILFRPVKECAVVHPRLPEEIRAAARAFAADRRRDGEALADEWLNNGPAVLAKQLPDAWEKRTEGAFRGAALKLQSLCREDFLRVQLFALCDRGLDLADCLAVTPTADELATLLPWVEQQDLNPDWPTHVRATFADLGKNLDHRRCKGGRGAAAGGTCARDS